MSESLDPATIGTGSSARHARYRPYPDYKDTEVDGLNKIPSHWTATRLKRVCKFEYGASLPSEIRSSRNVPVYGSNGAVGTHESANALGPCLVIGRKGSFGRVNYCPIDIFAIDTTFYVDRRSTKADIRWLYYLLSHNRLDAASRDSAIPGLDREDAYARRVVLCDYSEQRAIAGFLDRETAKIDALVAKKKQLIGLLKEKRAALITHAVTKGLDPTVSMKESGVGYVHRIPRHWRMKRLKYLVRESLKYGANEPAKFVDHDQPRYVRITDIQDDGTLKDDTYRSIPSVVATEYLLTDGDILLARSGATVGKAFRYTSNWGDAAYAGYLIRARMDERVMRSDFVLYFTQSQIYRDWLLSNLIQSTIQNVSAERYASLQIPVAQLEEQRTIAIFLDRETARIDQLISKVQEAIDRLNELRLALISAAVTGKIDVREPAA